MPGTRSVRRGMPFADPPARRRPPARTAQADGPALPAAFIALCGEGPWHSRVAELGLRMQPGSLSGRAAQQRHALELALSRLCGPPRHGQGRARPNAASAPSRRMRWQLAASLPPAGPRARLQDQHPRRADRRGDADPAVPPAAHRRAAARPRLHPALRPAWPRRHPYDLLAERGGATAEVVCETVSAEEGRQVHRGDWWALVDAINPELQTWLAAHPGRYLLKMTLPDGISGPDQLAELQRRISAMLAAEKRQDSGAAGGAEARPADAGRRPGAGPRGGGLPARLRAQFGPEAHLAVTTAPGSGSVFAMAARAGRENEIAAAVCRRLALAAESRLSGRHPGILAVFLDDLDRPDWRGAARRAAGAGRRGAPLPDHARRRGGWWRSPAPPASRCSARRTRRRRASCASATRAIPRRSIPASRRPSSRRCESPDAALQRRQPACISHVLSAASIGRCRCCRGRTGRTGSHDRA